MVQIRSGFGPLFFDPSALDAFTAPLASGATETLADQFARSGALTPEIAAFIQGAGQGGGVNLDLGAMLSQLGQTQMAGRNAGEFGTQNFTSSAPSSFGVQGASGVTDPTIDELTQAFQEMFEELSTSGMPLEARPDSKLAEALATGDFSQIPPAEMMALLVALALYGQNRNNPGQVAQQGNMPLAPRGSWKGGSNSAGGGSQHTGANAPAASPSGPAPSGRAPTTSSPSASRIGDSAERVANRMGSTGWCYRGVANALAEQGVTVSGGSAYMAANQLAGMPDKFQEIEVSPNELRNLPRGAVVVWGKTGASPHGHISVALGDGREASDHIQTQMTSLRGATNYRVFLPKG